MALTAPLPAATAPQARAFRDAVGRFATGVAFVTAAPDGEPAGLIINSLTSVSLEPPLVSFCPSRSSLTWSRMRRARRFGVNILGRQHKRFASHPPAAAAAGSSRCGLNHCELEPGQQGSPLHIHSAEEEIYVVLAGSGEALLGDETYPLRPGSVLWCPPASRFGHALRAGADGMTYLAFGTRCPGEWVYYPRSSKVSLRGGVMFRVEPVEYWDGEERE